jgi:chorismate synthase
LAGALKYGHKDLRNVLERASARETAARVAAGALASQLLETCGGRITGYVVQIGRAAMTRPVDPRRLSSVRLAASPVRCPEPSLEKKMVEEIRKAGRDGDTVGGIFEILATGLPAGLGSYAHWDRRLDGRLAQAVMSIQAIKGVEIGRAFRHAAERGSQVHDEINYHRSTGFGRYSHRSGGLEGGVTTGGPLLIRAAMKPISTLRKPLRSVDIVTKKAVLATHERSDVCAVPAASVVGEAMVAWVLADALVEKFGSDSLREITGNLRAYLKQIKR